ncbi:MAG: hypothetical protein HKN23_12425 [Verrucomicrobiales bacterium]|nr:hypothetical protein [Verrucomicrobiales bacterium]
MNLRLGWTFSGLVVPGYLVPLVMVKPWAAAIICVQSVIVYGMVRGLAKVMPKTGFGCAFFGRDRFFAMILCSIAVRLVSDGWLLPAAGAWMAGQWDLKFDFETDLHSFGLIVISLTANQFWKSGLLRGAVPFVFNIAVTWFVVRWILMEGTNFSITNLAFLYEDIATDIDSSPKAYIVMITTSIIASRMNLRYGWDFNGIMIPALLAVQWYEPMKILTSVVEAIVILYLSTLLMKSPLLRDMTMEGARKMLLFFTVSFGFKLVVGHAAGFAFPDAKVSDFYGFGYLLPTLMAMKMHQLKSVVQQVGITLQISLVSILIANVIGFSFTLLPESWRKSSPLLAAEGGEAAELSRGKGFEKVLERKIERLYEVYLPAQTSPPELRHLVYFERGISRLVRASRYESSRFREEGIHFVQISGMEVRLIDDRYVIISSPDPASGRGVYAIDLRSESDLVVECPYPLDEPGAVVAARWLFREHGAKALAIGGRPKGLERLGREGVTRDAGSYFHKFHLAAGKTSAIQVRTGEAHELRVEGELPPELSLKAIEERAGTFRLAGSAGRERNIQRGTNRSHFAEWIVTGGELQNLAGGRAEIHSDSEPFTVSQLPLPAAEGSDDYRPMRPGEVLRFQQTVLVPLLEIQSVHDPRIGFLQSQAKQFGYEIRVQGDLLVLAEIEGRRMRHTGSLIVRADSSASSLVIEVPGRHQNLSLANYAHLLFDQLRARALLISGCHRAANADGSSALTQPQNIHSVFNAAHQACLDRPADGSRLVLQIHAFHPDPGELFPKESVLISPFLENLNRDEIKKALRPFESLLERDGVLHAWADASDPASFRYQLGLNIQSKYLDHVENATFASIWLSPDFRRSYGVGGENRELLAQLDALGIPVYREGFAEKLGAHPIIPGDPGLSAKIRVLFDEYRNTNDISLLQEVQNLEGLRVECVLEPGDSNPVFLFLVDDSTVAAARFFPISPRSVSTEPGDFLRSRKAWLMVEERGADE